MLRLSPKDAGKKGHFWLGARQHSRLSRITPGLLSPGTARCPIVPCIRIFLLPVPGQVLLSQVERTTLDRANSFRLE